MRYYRDAAIVIRTHKLGEADRIITMLTRQRGVVRAVAKGVRRTSSKFGARLEPGMVVDVQCYEGRNLDTVTQAEMLAPYGEAIVGRYEAWTSAQVMLEASDRLTEEGVPAPQQFMLLAGALASLAAEEHDPDLTLSAYLLRALATAGWAASFGDCARCGAPGPHRAAEPAAGGVLCPSCRGPASRQIGPETVSLLAALLSGDWAVADASPADARREAGVVVTDFTTWHLERGLRSWTVVGR